MSLANILRFNIKQISSIFIVCVGLFLSDYSFARGLYLDYWREFYPESSSDDAGCQLCHQMPGGQNGWNRYGWTIRPLFLAERADNGGDDRLALFDTLKEIEDRPNVDATDSYVFIDEIRYNTQPGWVEGNNNTINFRPEDEDNDPPVPPLENQAPPTLAMNALTEIDLNVTAVNDPIPNQIPTGALEIELYDVATGFLQPVKAVRAPGINGSLFVVEKFGKVFRVDLATGIKTKFLDVSSTIDTTCNECGLLSLAFHPDFETNGLFYTYQSEPRRIAQDSEVDFTTLLPNVAPDHRAMIVEYKATDPSCNSFIHRRETLLVIDQPQGNHNGGDIAFDDEGYLYISLGDGGGADDQGNSSNPSPEFDGHGLLGNGRDKTSILGSILRIDVDSGNSTNGKYGIPSDNPFIANNDDGIDEIFAFGFRNPYRISFDMNNGDLYAGDVGQNNVEEIDSVVNGGNYGWNWKEGNFYFIDPDGQASFLTNDVPPGVPTDLIDPRVEYDHDEGISVTGGFVYRGDNVAGLDGKYVFGDYSRIGERRLLYFNTTDTNPVLNEFIMVNPLADNITGFGQDVEGEVYVVTNPGFSPSTEGKLKKVMAPSETYAAPNAGDEVAQCSLSDEVCVPIKTSNGNIALICL